MFVVLIAKEKKLEKIKSYQYKNDNIIFVSFLTWKYGGSSINVEDSSSYNVK